MLVPVAGIDTIELSNNHMWRLKPQWTLWGRKPPAWMNCADTAAGWADYGFQMYYALLNSGFCLRVSAGTANGVHPVPLGYSRVYVKIDGDFTYEKWVNALQKGRNFATNGPMLIMKADDMYPGEHKTIEPGKEKLVKVSVEAFSVRPIDRTEIIVNGKTVFTHRPPENEQGITRHSQFVVQVRVDGTSWIAARCFEVPPLDNVRFAHTAPVFFDDPTRRLVPSQKQIGFLIESVEQELRRVEGKLSDDAVAEYREALKAYRLSASSQQ